MARDIQSPAIRAGHRALTLRVALVAVLTAVPMMSGCNSGARHGRIRHWGTLHEVLGQGRTHERVRLAPPVIRDHTHGVGAITGLRGEITIIDGEAWVSYADASGGLVCRSDVASRRSATFLATAEVTDWREFVLDKDVSPDRFEETIARFGASAGLDATSGFPFVVDGPLSPIELHVINGRCPHAGNSEDTEAGTDPIRWTRASAIGTLVGFYAEDSGGVLTHHGSRTHVHVLLPGDAPIAGHVDGVGIRRGGRVRVPDVSGQR